MHSKFEYTYDVPYILLPYTTVQCSRVFPKEKSSVCSCHQPGQEQTDGRALLIS